MSIRISYSANGRYQKSPRYYYLHDILKLREAKVGSPLLFGSAIDTALNSLLLSEGDPHAVFDEQWEKQPIHGKVTNLNKSKDIKYSKSDLDYSLLDEEDQKLIKTGVKAEWLSLKKKGHILIDAYKEQIMPRIQEVIAVQKYVSFKNNEGDSLIGYIDAIVRWEDGRVLLVDNKTSSSRYKPSDVKNSDQLGTYDEIIDSSIKIDACAYIVLPKNLRKKKLPKAEIQIIIDTVDESIKDQIFEQYDETIEGIKLGKFPCHTPNCDQYYGDCPYKSYCKSDGKDLTGLIKVEKK